MVNPLYLGMDKFVAGIEDPLSIAVTPNPLMTTFTDVVTAVSDKAMLFQMLHIVCFPAGFILNVEPSKMYIIPWITCKNKYLYYIY